MSRIFYDEIHRRYRKPRAFITQLKAKMELHGVSQAAVARVSGFHPTNVSRWLGENERVLPTMETMVILDETVDRIIEGET